MSYPDEPISAELNAMIPDGAILMPVAHLDELQSEIGRLAAQNAALSHKLNKLSDWGNLYEKMRALIDDLACHESWQLSTGHALARLIEQARTIRELDAALTPAAQENAPRKESEL